MTTEQLKRDLLVKAVHAFDDKYPMTAVQRMDLGLLIGDAVDKIIEQLSAQTAEPVAWMTDDGRVAMSDTKKCMPSASSINFNIPLVKAHPAKTEQPPSNSNVQKVNIANSAAVQTEQPSLSDEQAWKIYLQAQESIPFEYSSGKEFAVAWTKAILSAQRQDSNMTFSGYFDEDEYQGITIEKFLKHRNESEGMDAWEIGHEFQVDAVYSRTEQWRVTNDVPWTAERIDCAAIANGAQE